MMKCIFLLISLLLVSCNAEVKRVEGGSSMPFIEAEDVMKNLAQGGDSIGYTLSECNLLLSDSLQGDLIIDLENSYQDIEDLINNPDKKFRERRPLNKSKLQTPILKHKNRVLVKWEGTDEISSDDYAYVFELVKPKQMTIVSLIYETLSQPDYVPLLPVIGKKDSTWITPPEFDDKFLMEFLRKNTNYPKSAMKDSIRGVIYVSFWLETDFAKSDFRVVRSISGDIDEDIRKEFDEEALRVAKLMHFSKPAFQNGKPVRYEMTMPISFRLLEKTVDTHPVKSVIPVHFLSRFSLALQK